MAFFAVLLYLYARIPKNKYYLPLLITGAALASGALGNFIDRLLYGYVIDFIYVSLIDFPVFNVADIFVVCGGIAFVILVGFCYKDEDFDFIKRKRDVYKRQGKYPSMFSTAKIGCPAATVPIKGTFTTSLRTRLN